MNHKCDELKRGSEDLTKWLLAKQCCSRVLTESYKRLDCKCSTSKEGDKLGQLHDDEECSRGSDRS